MCSCEFGRQQFPKYDPHVWEKAARYESMKNQQIIVLWMGFTHNMDIDDKTLLWWRANMFEYSCHARLDRHLGQWTWTVQDFRTYDLSLQFYGHGRLEWQKKVWQILDNKPYLTCAQLCHWEVFLKDGKQKNTPRIWRSLMMEPINRFNMIQWKVMISIGKLYWGKWSKPWNMVWNIACMCFQFGSISLFLATCFSWFPHLHQWKRLIDC